MDLTAFETNIESFGIALCVRKMNANILAYGWSLLIPTQTDLFQHLVPTQNSELIFKEIHAGFKTNGFHIWILQYE